MLVVIFTSCSTPQIEEIEVESLGPWSPNESWWPHEVGNYWMNRNFVPCDPIHQTWYWEVVQTIETDSADYFLIEEQGNPCDSTNHFEFFNWYALTSDNKLYTSNSDFEYGRLEADFELNVNDSFLGMGLRYTVIEKTEYKMSFEYDIYQAGTYTRRFIKGIGRDLQWNEVRISGEIVKVK